MMLNVFSYYIVCNLFSNCSEEITLFPKMTSPKFIRNFRELFKYLAARYAFDYPNHFRYRIPWGKRYQYVNVIFRYFTSIYFEIKMTCYFKKKLLYSWSNFFIKDLFSIFRTPNQMILGFINRMACSFQWHAVTLIGKHPFLKPHGKSPMRHEKWILSRFSSPTKGRSIQAHFS